MFTLPPRIGPLAALYSPSHAVGRAKPRGPEAPSTQGWRSGCKGSGGYHREVPPRPPEGGRAPSRMRSHSRLVPLSVQQVRSRQARATTSCGDIPGECRESSGMIPDGILEFRYRDNALSKGSLSPRCRHGGSDALREGGEAWVPPAPASTLERLQVLR